MLIVFVASVAVANWAEAEANPALAVLGPNPASFAAGLRRVFRLDSSSPYPHACAGSLVRHHHVCGQLPAHPFHDADMTSDRHASPKLTPIASIHWASASDALERTQRPLSGLRAPHPDAAKRKTGTNEAR